MHYPNRLDALAIAQMSLTARLLILAFQAWILYWWFKRQRRLDTVATVVRVLAISAGVALMFLAAQLDNSQNQLEIMRFVVLPASALIVVFLFFPDASYFLAESIKKLFHRGSK
jgi:sterol desaturase/sphingolipid hydroxylase (fatty acid hydroxylase superfamily)